MNYLVLAASALFWQFPQAFAQDPPPTTPVAPSQERIDELLKAWEKRTAGVDSLMTAVTRTDIDPLTKKETIYVGQIAIMKPNLLRFDLTHEDEVGKKDSEKTRLERLYFDSKHIYEFVSNEKLILVHERISKEKAATLDKFIRDLRFAFENISVNFPVFAVLRGMKADDVKKRFNLVLQEPKDSNAKWYAYLMIVPKTEDDKQKFVAAQLTLWLKNPNAQGEPDLTMTPARFWYRKVNGAEVTYLFKNMQPNAKLKPADFTPGDVEGYQRKEVP